MLKRTRATPTSRERPQRLHSCGQDQGALRVDLAVLGHGRRQDLDLDKSVAISKTCLQKPALAATSHFWELGTPEVFG